MEGLTSQVYHTFWPFDFFFFFSLSSPGFGLQFFLSLFPSIFTGFGDLGFFFSFFSSSSFTGFGDLIRISFFFFFFFFHWVQWSDLGFFFFYSSSFTRFGFLGFFLLSSFFSSCSFTRFGETKKKKKTAPSDKYRAHK